MTATEGSVLRPSSYLVDPRALTPMPTGFCAHLDTYPTYVSFKNAFYAIPLTKRTVKILRPPVRYVRNTNPIKFVIDRGDSFADGALCRVDSAIPALKTLEIRDILSPLRGRTLRPQTNLDAGARPQSSWNRRVVAPTTNFASAVRSQLSNAVCSGSKTGNNATRLRTRAGDEVTDPSDPTVGDPTDDNGDGCPISNYVEKLWNRNGSSSNRDGAVHIGAVEPVSAINESHATRAPK